MSNRSRRAIGYVRVSVDRDTKVSPDVQRKGIEDYCAGKGWELVEVVVERGRSAAHGKQRPKFERALQRIEAGDADTLVVFKLDRATRSTLDFYRLTQERLGPVGAEFVSVTDAFDTTTAMGRAMVGITAVFAELERDQISERMKHHYAHQRREGLGPNGVAPFGYVHDADRRLIVDPVAAPWVARIVEWVIEGATLREIARRLVAEGAPTPPRSRDEWQYGAVRLIVLNPHIAALRVDPESGALLDAPWEPIVDRDRWDCACAVLTDPARKTTKQNERTLLSGIARCGKCGAPMRPGARDGVKRYRCIKSEQFKDACQGVTINAEPLEEYVVETVMDLVGAIDLPDPTVGPGEDPDDVQQQLDDLAASWGRGDISRGEWRAARSALVTRLQRIEATNARHRDPRLIDFANARNVEAAWPMLDRETQRAVLRDLFDEITIGPAKIRGDVAHRTTFKVSD